MQSEQPQMTNLRGKVALVTGASSGIGEAIAEELVQRGARVALFARRENRLQELAQRLAGQGSEKPLIVPGDVCKPEDVQDLVHQTMQRWGKLDIVVANAGFGDLSPIVDGDPQRWKNMLDTNVYGLLLTLKYGVEQLLKRGWACTCCIFTCSKQVFLPCEKGVFSGFLRFASKIVEHSHYLPASTLFRNQNEILFVNQQYDRIGGKTLKKGKHCHA